MIEPGPGAAQYTIFMQNITIFIKIPKGLMKELSKKKIITDVLPCGPDFPQAPESNVEWTSVLGLAHSVLNLLPDLGNRPLPFQVTRQVERIMSHYQNPH